MALICLAISTSKSDFHQSLTRALTRLGHEVQDMPLNVGIASGYFKGRSSKQPDVLILDGDLENIKTLRRKADSTDLADYETVALPPSDFLRVMRDGDVYTPCLAISDDINKKQILVNSGADNFVPAHIGLESIVALTRDLAQQAEQDLDPNASEPSPEPPKDFSFE